MRFILSYMKRHSASIAMVMIIKFMASLCELMIPYVLEYMIDDIAPLKSPRLILIWGLVMLVLALGVRLLNVTANRGSVKIARKCIYSVREDLFSKSIRLPIDQMDEMGLPSLISRMTSDSYNIQSFMQTSQTLGVRAPMLLVGGIAVTLTMDRGLASILCIMAPFLIAAVFFVSRKGIPLYEKVQTKLDTLVRVMRENITGVRVIKALSKEEYEKRRFAKLNDEMTRAELKASIVMSLPGPVVSILMNVGLTIVVLFGAYRVNKGVTKPGVILAFLTYFQMILMGVLTLNRFFLNMSKANASANRIEAVMTNSKALEVDTDLPLYEDSDYIEFRNVDFSYGKCESQDSTSFAGGQRENTLSNISFTLKKGQSLGIIGATGSGKSTIVNLLLRFYDAQSGQIILDGRDIRSYEVDSLRRRFGVVLQSDAIFADSIRNNIVFGRTVSEDALRRATEHAMASEFISGYEDGLEHESAIHGANFSGGQKQRLLISRALAANPEILVLDDSSSALDYRTDSQLRHNIRVHHSEATTIIIAQRISSIMQCDHIIMLDEGRIVGQGKHEELLQSTDSYREIFETQMGEV